ncbi:MAG: hypothetical protein M4579_000279 [Chaenotheca gracillima]|nr:MAG: hypothetical protein M4579_000279 [Chaenotheca gracillima]
MAGTVSIGDVMMLSQVAWKIGCAFTAGRTGAPREFEEVENECFGLTTALDSLAEALDDTECIMLNANERTRAGVSKVLICCQQTLQDLSSFVVRYQELKPVSGGDNSRGGNVQRSWKGILVRNFKTIWWTTEGGNIQSLRNMLNMHCNSISLTMQALESKSLSRLEKTVAPMAVQVNEVHDLVTGNMNTKIDDMHFLLLSMASQRISGSQASSGYANSVDESGPSKEEEYKGPGHSEKKSGYRSSSNDPPGLSRSTTMQQSPGLEPSLSASWGTSPPPQKDNGIEQASGWQNSFPLKKEDSRLADESQRGSLYPVGSPPRYTERQRAPSAVSYRSSDGSTPQTPQPSELGSPPSIVSDPEVWLPPPKLVAEDTKEINLSPNSSTASALQNEEFKRALWRNAVTLCEVDGKCVEYAHKQDHDTDFEMVRAAAECRIYLVQKQDRLPSGSIRHVASIWTMSNDRSVRLQQKLTDGQQVIPYTVWGASEKISIRIDSMLKFHDVSFDASSLDTVKTSWVNYVFRDEDSSVAFQNALMDKKLLLSVKTKKTIRIHDGLAGTFAYQEQMCALENLRIWQDHSTHAAIAMIHYTPQFRDGYLTFFLNSSRDPIKVREDGDRAVKIKGLNVPLKDKESLSRAPTSPDLQGHTPKPKSEKMIRAARIEFITEEDRRIFLEKVREVQGTFFAG